MITGPSDGVTQVDPSPWDTSVPVPSLTTSEGTITLVDGQTFCRSARNGDLHPDRPEGLFVLDTRVLSRWQLRVDHRPVEALAASTDEPWAATFAARVHASDGKADSDVAVFRHRSVGRGMSEQIAVENYGIEPRTLVVELVCDADFADLFSVKEARVPPATGRLDDTTPTTMRFSHTDANASRGVTVTWSKPAATDESGVARWHIDIAPKGRWQVQVEVVVLVDGVEIEPTFRTGGDGEATASSARLAIWKAGLPTVTTDHADLAAVIARSGDDLGALRIFDPEHPDTPVIAAGAPWFMTLFGRDALLTSWMTMIADPSLALGVLTTLARLQGSDVDPSTEEEPGKILHEVRFAGAEGPAFSHGERYYGSIDATPLFVMLAGELSRWGQDEATINALLPHVERAMAWIETHGDRDGDGYVEYQRASPRGLANQGWKDSWDGVRAADGRMPPTPIALCEVQGYVYAAYLARAQLARQKGDAETHDRYLSRAAALRERFNTDFWSEEHGWYVLGLDADKRQIDALASNIGHCLWTGIVDEERAPLVAERLLSPEMFTGWGVRTLASSMTAYNPVSYHNGSIWPHDNAICAEGLARYGFVEEAHRIIEGQLAVAATAGGRLPELFAGFDRSQLRVPASYPASCSPQAWASAAPLLWLRTFLRLDPHLPDGEVFLRPELPGSVRNLDIDGIAVGAHELHVQVANGHVDIGTSEGAPFRMRHEPLPVLPRDRAPR